VSNAKFGRNSKLSEPWGALLFLTLSHPMEIPSELVEWLQEVENIPSSSCNQLDKLLMSSVPLPTP
jgi:hypothetical protein